MTTDDIMALADWLDDLFDADGEPKKAAAELRRLHAENEALRADAERYRWLRQYNTVKHPKVTEAFFLGDGHLDAAIDAAMKGQP